MIVMAFGTGDHEPPVFWVGVDIMKVKLPQREPFLQFIRIFSEQVSYSENFVSIPANSLSMIVNSFGNSCHTLRSGG